MAALSPVLRDDSDMTSEEFTNGHPALAQFWHPVALSSEVGPEPAAGRLGGRGWALARFGGGIVAFADACPHRRARLSAGQITGGTLQCAYHGWQFTPDGRCVNIPALEDTAAIPERATLHRPAEVAEQDGMVWLAPESPRAPIPDLHPGVPLAGDGVATVILPVLAVEANAAILIDNFLDEAHLPFVHAATIGGAGPEPIPRADVDRRGLSFTAVREHTFTNLTDPAVRDGARPAVQRRRMTYRYQAPLTATLLLEYLDAEGWQFLTFTVAPEDERTCRVYQTVTGPGLTDPEQAESTAKYEMSIFDEDLDLQRRALSGLEFPLDVTAELHTRADRVSVEFRRVLAAAVSG
jgi:vanillate O-demethylase monooxygenase subunit